MPGDLRKPLPWAPVAEAGETPVLLIRHGQTAWNRERRMLGRTDVPLDPEGHEQARLLAQALAPVPLAAVYASPLLRARQTAEPLLATRPGLSLRLVEGLVELDQGEFDGQESATLIATYADFFEAWRADPGSTRVPGGETLGECQARALAALHSLLAGHPPGPPVAVITHQMVLASVLCAASEQPLRHYSGFSQRNTAINLLAWNGDRLRVVLLGEHGHLPPAGPPRPLAV